MRDRVAVEWWGGELEKRLSRLPQGTKCSKADTIEATLSFLVPNLTTEKVPTKPRKSKQPQCAIN